MKYSLSIFALSLIAFQPANAIEVEYHLYPGMNYISVPCSLTAEQIESMFPVTTQMPYLSPGDFSNTNSGFRPSGRGFWMQSMKDTVISIDCGSVAIGQDNTVADSFKSMIEEFYYPTEEYSMYKAEIYNLPQPLPQINFVLPGLYLELPPVNDARIQMIWTKDKGYIMQVDYPDDDNFMRRRYEDE
jgi:hypothetical protein